MPLTDIEVKKIKYTREDGKPQRHYDANGMYLEILATGAKYWRMKYKRPNGKESRLAFGVYPTVSLKEARTKRDEALELIRQGTDPSAQKKEEKLLSVLTIAPDVLAVCRVLENQNKLETAHRIKAKCGQVFRYAIATGRSTYDPTQALRGALKPIEAGHRAAITDPIEVAKLLTAINSYQGQFVTQCALKLAPLVFVRPGELRTALWQEIDLEAKEWRYNVSKTNTQHIVPLSRQAVAILTDLHQQTGHSIYVFPSVLTIKRPMSDNTINPALRRLGYSKDEMCGHGFRAMARTILEEVLEYPIEIIEQQLAHQVKDMHGRAYNRTKHLAKRHKMMQHWADYLDQLQGKNVIHADFGQQKPA
jgi:integrase